MAETPFDGFPRRMEENERLYPSAFEGPSVLERQPGGPLKRNQQGFTGQRQAEWHPSGGLLECQADTVYT